VADGIGVFPAGPATGLAGGAGIDVAYLSYSGPKARDRRVSVPRGGEAVMVWETPEFTEIKMDAEVSAYQEDLA
jgi:hypothetical protein